jgi:hypothetical protein
MKNSNDTIGNRTRDPAACSAVPQPTAPPRAPGTVEDVIIFRGRDVATARKGTLLVGN